MTIPNQPSNKQTEIYLVQQVQYALISYRDALSINSPQIGTFRQELANILSGFITNFPADPIIRGPFKFIIVSCINDLIRIWGSAGAETPANAVSYYEMSEDRINLILDVIENSYNS